MNVEPSEQAGALTPRPTGMLKSMKRQTDAFAYSVGADSSPQGLDFSEPSDLDDYRRFRRTVLASLTHDENGDDEQVATHSRNPWRHASRPVDAGGRALIIAFREIVMDRFLDCDFAAEDEPSMRRALGLSPSCSVKRRSVAIKVLRAFAFRDKPEPNWAQAKVKISSARTRHGRRLLFELHCARLIPFASMRTDIEDLILHRLSGPVLQRDYGTICLSSWDTVSALYRLGCRDGATMASIIRRAKTYLPAGAIAVAAKLGLVKDLDDLELLFAACPRERDHYGTPDLEELTRSLEALLKVGASRSQIFPLFNEFWWDSRALVDALEFLGSAGFNGASVYSAIGPTLWRAKLANWDFVLSVLGVNTTEYVKRFEPTLRSDSTPSADTVRILRRSGASMDELVGCQETLCAAAAKGDSPARLTCLMAAPWNVAPKDLPRIESLLTLSYSEQLLSWLNTLAACEFAGLEPLLEFAPCFPVAGDRFGALLDLALARRSDSSLSAIVAWIVDVAKSSPTVWNDSLEFVCSRFDVRTLTDLQAASQCAVLSRGLLAYLVDERSMGTLAKLRKWARSSEGRRAEAVKLGARYDEAERVLLDAAYEHCRMGGLPANLSVLYSVIGELASAATSHLPGASFRADETDRISYWAARDVERHSVDLRCAKVLANVLADNRGVLQPTLLAAACDSPGAYSRARAEILPLLAGLLQGEGPSSHDLSELQACAIGQVYGITAGDVKERWQNVVGFHPHLDEWRLRPSYQPGWSPLVMTAKAGARLDHAALQGLVDASRVGLDYLDAFKTDDYALRGLKAQALRHPSADFSSLRYHLGALLALGAADSRLAEWTSHRLQRVTEITSDAPDAFSRLSQINELLCVILPDALLDLDHSQASYGAANAELLAMRLSAADGTTEKSTLRQAVDECLVVVRAVAERWWRREEQKFQGVATDGSIDEGLRAVVSKHPAAFYAKLACRLCSAPNTSMWGESRHAHLLVFDATEQRLVGMAMLYRQIIEEVDRNVHSLVVRAINPTVEASSAYDPESVVRGVLTIAETIAADNGCAAVLLTPSGSQHFLSNRMEVQHAVDRMFGIGRHGAGIPRVKTISRRESVYGSQGALFYGYEDGSRRDGAVDELIVVWQARPGDVDSLAKRGKSLKTSVSAY